VSIKELRAAAAAKHDEVCDLHFDHGRMNADGTCRECQEDLMEYEILRRRSK